MVRCELCKKLLSCEAALIRHKDFCKVARRLKLKGLYNEVNHTKVEENEDSDDSTNDGAGDAEKMKKAIVNGTNAKLVTQGTSEKEPSKDPLRFRCQICGVEMTDEAKFQQHKEVCIDTYNCEACGVKFKTQAKYIEHKGKHKECVSIDDMFVEEIHSCGACFEKFNTPLKVTIHANKCHKGAENHKAMALYRKDLRQCQVCKVKINKYTTPYYHHMWQAHGVKSNYHAAYYRCDFCHERYIDPREFEAHEASHEENKMRHACNICEQKFRRKQLLERHMNEKHSGKLKQD